MASPAGFSVTRESGTYQVKAGADLDGLIAIRDYLWSPDNYVGLAESALGPLATAPNTDPEPAASIAGDLVRRHVRDLQTAAAGHGGAVSASANQG